MDNRTRVIASFFSVAMAAMLLGALVTTQIQRPDAAFARPAEPLAAAIAAPQARSTAPLTLDTFKDIAHKVSPGVVNITTSKTVSRQHLRDPFRDFFGDDLLDRFSPNRGGGPDRQTQRALGSGFVIDKSGYVLTNRHVIDEADQITVNLPSGKAYSAKIVGKDARTDVALLKIEPKEPLTVLDLGDSQTAEVGEWVMAIGNPFNLSGTVTVGVVSFKGRSIALGVEGTSVDMIQTDAAINPGNSGGPLLNTRGEVIGINTLIFTQGAMQSAGVGFAVPINVAREILPQLREKGKVARGWLGVTIQPVTEDMAKTFKMAEAKGAIVGDVRAGSPADKAGVKPGDVVVAADGHKIADSNELSHYIASKAPGTTVHLQVLRDGAEKSVSIDLGTFPEENEQAAVEKNGKAQLGMTLKDLTGDLAERLELPRTARGVVIMNVEAGSAAEDAGLQQTDVIVSVNGRTVETVDAFEAEITRAKPDGLARLRVRRAEGYRFIILKLS
jgi:serine protease Do